MSEYHVPVLLEECLVALDIKEAGAYVDVTFGGGGHSNKILERLGDNGALIGFDQDADAAKNVPDDARFHFAHSNYKHLKRFLRLFGYQQVDGILADLGVSSHQLDVAERGFSFRFEADLDMRMNQQADKTAIDIINNYSAIELQRVFGQYGEVRNSKTLAERIVQERQRYMIKTSTQFLNIIGPLIRGQRNRYLAQVFQALRIEVNDEINSIRTFLEESAEVLPVGGKLVIISYHSLEDRVVKNFLKFGNFEGKPEKDFYGNILKPFKMITRKPILPTPEEVKINPKSRSAKLRIAEKL
ncbi:MAG: 16S rRNA (cytosine(1402)-N(4))-methyltransferase RsmH [Saprospiraceae bacterium]